MGFLKKLFGGGASLEGLRKAVEQRRFADARRLAEQLSEQALPESDVAEVAKLQIAAGDGLAHLNLEEARGFQSAGETELATEHLQLALEQVYSDELRREIEQASAKPLVPTIEPAGQPHGSDSCAGCGSQNSEPLLAEELELPDSDSQLELILTSYPPTLAERYRQKSEAFLQAFLLSHSGRDEVAIPIWQQVTPIDQDELYWFEFGAAQARCGNTAESRKSLENALSINPDLLQASEVLIQLLVSRGETDQALIYLQQMLERKQDPVFCHVQLTLVRLQQKQPQQALVHARQAVACGVQEADFLQLTASLLEQAGELDEAEKILQHLPGGGCGGGISLPLAEFLLRQKRDLAKVLDSFNAACRQDPQNPRWQLRVAQTYMARNWRKEGFELLHKVIDDPQLGPELRQEAELLLADQGS